MAVPYEFNNMQELTSADFLFFCFFFLFAGRLELTIFINCAGLRFCLYATLLPETRTSIDVSTSSADAMTGSDALNVRLNFVFLRYWFPRSLVFLSVFFFFLQFSVFSVSPVAEKGFVRASLHT